MAGYKTDLDRKVIPRWRTLRDTHNQRELNSTAPSRPRQEATTDLLAQKAIDWQNHQTVGHATDLVGAALTLGREREAIEAANFLIQDKLRVSPWARELAEQTLGILNGFQKGSLKPEAMETSILHGKVNSIRYSLRTEPQDPISWVELARVYTTLGLKKQAERSMIVGLQLAGNNRFVLRSASRFWVHFDDPEQAHYILFKADRTRHDPWLLAAEIAVGSIEGRIPKFVKFARKILKDGRFSPSHISELASALATLELNSGNVNKSKKLFRQSLEDPTENSIAQVAWASSRPQSTIPFQDQYLTLSNAYEAEYWVCYQKCEWQKAVEQCELWQLDQLFSSEPSIHGSYVAAVALEDYQTSQRIAERGLIANPGEFKLLNNLAFSCINLGNIEEAKQALSRVYQLKLSDRDRVTLSATQGLLEFRSGNVTRGRELYLEAQSMARKMPKQVRTLLLALSTTFHALEESSLTESHFHRVLGEAFGTLKLAGDPIFGVLEDRLLKRKAKLQDTT